MNVDELIESLQKSGKGFLYPERDKFVQVGDKVYAQGKWTVKDIIQHLIDFERIFSYRALRFARNDKIQLSGYDENIYAITANGSNRELDGLLEEFYVVRESTIRLYKSFSPEMLTMEGQIPSGNISVFAIGVHIIKHTIHHIGVIKEKYYGLIE